MADVNPHHMIEELKANILTGDAMKAQLVLACLQDVSREFQKELILLLATAEADFCLPQFFTVLREQPGLAASQPLLRETLFSVILSHAESVPQYLFDEAFKDKIPLVKIIGELRMEEATSALLDFAAETDDERVILQVIESLGMIGDPESINTLTDYLYSADRELIVAAVKALGAVGTSLAIERLVERMGTDNDIDYLILTIFAHVQDQISLEQLNGAIMSHYAYMRTFAKEELTRIGSKAVPFLIKNLEHSDDDFIIHTLNVLGDIGDDSAVPSIRRLLGREPENANVRFAAYEALALLPLRKGAYTLTAGLTDPEESVCIAAAKAIDRNFSELLGAGLRNLLRGPRGEAEHMVKIIIDSQADNIFTFLVDDELFEELGVSHMAEVHPEIRGHYRELLVKIGKEESPFNVTAKDEEARPKILAVDDSRMILGIYKNILHGLGYEPVLFEFPASALEWLKQEKPLAVFTDLNMPKITGIDLARQVREQYSSKLLPIIMVTTQNEVEDHNAARAAGVNGILAKPFNAEALRAALSEVLSS